MADGEFIEVYRSILGSSTFRHGFSELADFQELMEFNVTGDTMRHLCELVDHYYEGQPENTKTAIIAPKDYVFGMGRMYGLYADPDSEYVRVFKDADEAMRSMGLISVSLAELHGEKPGIQ